MKKQQLGEISDWGKYLLFFFSFSIKKVKFYIKF